MGVCVEIVSLLDGVNYTKIRMFMGRRIAGKVYCRRVRLFRRQWGMARQALHDTKESYGVMVIVFVAVAVPPPIAAVALIVIVCGDVTDLAVSTPALDIDA